MIQTIPPEAWAEITACFARGSTVELKWIAGQVQVVEIRRKIKYKTPLATGQAEG